MAVEPTTRRPDASQRWLPYALTALALHLVWWYAVPARRATAAVPAPARPAFSYLGARHGGVPRAEDEVLSMWSPVLFSVPTRMGFSAPLLRDADGLRPPDNPALAVPILAARGTYLPPGMGPGPHDQLVSAMSSLVVRTVAPPAFPPRKAGTNVLLHIIWTDQRGAPRYQSVDVANADPWVDRKPWDAQAFLELDEQGAVTHVFLEKPTPLKDRNAALIRVLAALRMGPDDMARSGRVTVRSEGVAPPEAAAAP